MIDKEKAHCTFCGMAHGQAWKQEEAPFEVEKAPEGPN
jgi:hypothetical protein